MMPEHTNQRSSAHVTSLLPAYLGDTLSPIEVERVRAHLATCAECRAELATWAAIRDVAQAAATPERIPSLALLKDVWARLDAGEASSALGPVGEDWWRSATWITLTIALVRAQMRLVQPRLWLASAMVMMVGWLIAATAWAGASASLVLPLVAPLVAAYGVSLIYGSEVDPFLEVVCATPISLRLLLLARLTIVFAYDAALALAATLALAALGRVGADTVWGVTQNWLGPMLLLSALALVLSQHIGSSGSISLALVLWVVRVVAATNDHVGLMSPAVARLLISVWSTNALTIGCALLCVAAALSSTSGRAQGWRMT